ncbi:signal transduction protein [Saccharobesus litoralis]|uniref:Signal transduction protein n=1 Tax=Saccharobesus litoralis TaxID=2172099 RepID=A0A2S0VU07_9ALTE|nr:HDOD domain-containing protein [Saccharobesus litoralis]AWB67706.1 signal transduction protein [Saccharobesus litoralis]
MAQALDMAIIDSALENFQIPPRPDLLIELQKEIEKPEPSVVNIANLVNQDLAITNFTLKVVNSPMFGFPKKVTSINHACSFLGLTKLVKLVTSILLRYEFLKDEGNNFETALWGSSALLADACFAIAQYLDLAQPDDAYSVGMFHNAGMALILQQQPEYSELLKEAYEQEHLTLGLYEEENIATSHEVLGFLIAQQWGIDSAISNVIAYHHSHNIIMTTGSYEEKQLFSVLKLAEHMINLPSLLTKTDIDIEWQKHGGQILDYLELEDYQLQDLGEMLYGFGVANIFHD